MRRWHVSQWLGVTAGSIVVAGAVLIGVYAAAAPGPPAQYIGVGLLTAFAALVVGALVGFLFGIPKEVSSGEYRHKSSVSPVITRTATDSTETTTTVQSPVSAGVTATSSGAAGELPAGAGQRGQSTEADGGSMPAGEFAPSTNLSEVSDWLTKLLLGAGLVELTQLGGPLSSLVDAVASGLERVPAGGSPSGPAHVVAATVMITYVVVGFLSGYVVTTLWYGRRLREV